MSRISLAAVACAAVAGLLAGAALGDEPQLRPNARDQATAKRAVVQLSDFTAGSGWTGGPTKTSDFQSAKCNLDPKQSDLVQTAEAESAFRYKVPLLQVFSSATMYGSERMALLSWQRAKPGLLGFLRCLTTASLPSNTKVVSVKPMSFPRIGSFGGAYRTIFDVSASGTTLRMVIDVEVFGSGRTIFTLIQFAPYETAAAIRAGETRLAAAMTTRAGALTA